MTVVVVMADLFFSATIIGIAKKLGMTVRLVTDGAKALECARMKPAAVIFDLNYAAADPVGLIRQIRANAETQDIPVIGFVSHVQVELKQRALEAGCDPVLTRSVFAQRLPEILAQAAVTARS